MLNLWNLICSGLVLNITSNESYTPNERSTAPLCKKVPLNRSSTTPFLTMEVWRGPLVIWPILHLETTWKSRSTVVQQCNHVFLRQSLAYDCKVKSIHCPRQSHNNFIPVLLFSEASRTSFVQPTARNSDFSLGTIIDGGRFGELVDWYLEGSPYDANGPCCQWGERPVLGDHGAIKKICENPAWLIW